MQSNRPNIIVVICHDLGQHLNCYGAQDVRSPNIDRFAEKSLRFVNSFCTAPQCSPSRAALWTGRFPHANGVVGLTHGGFQNDLHPGERHLAQILGDGGYETHLFGNQHEARRPERCGHLHRHQAGKCAQVADGFVEFMAEHKDRSSPFFAEICFQEPHRPFAHEGVEPRDHASMTVPPWLPDIPEIREDLSNLEASVSSADKAFGRILHAVDSSDIADNTIVIFTADHGIAFPHAKMTLYDPGIQVPLIMRVPGVEGGVTRSEMVSNVDVVPTLLDLVGIPATSNLHGRSFKGCIAGEGCAPRDAVFAEKTYHTYYDPMRAIRTEQWKLIANFENAPWQETSPDYWNNAKCYVEVSKALKPDTPVIYHPPLELFDLRNDPHEQQNLADDPKHADTRNDLVRRLRQWMEETEDPLLDGPMPQAAYTSRMKAFKGI